MAKTKNKRNSGLADKVNTKRKGDIHKKKLNPFEVHINREKIKVLGKISKNDRGMPGVSRSKAMKKRRDAIGTELRLSSTANAFVDRRIGEKDGQLTSDDKMVARFTAERTKQHSKKNIFNLADDEVLTHRGQTLEQIEKFDDPRSSDEEDDAIGKKYGGLEDDFVSEGHFGGGMLSRTEKDGAKSHKDLIEQLIAESKKRKAEKQKEKEQTLDLTEKLDSEWKDLQPVVFKRARAEESLIDKVLSQAEAQAADYDKMMRELKFEKRGTPSDGIKTDEKQAKEERKKLEQLEKERLKRMYDEEDVATKAIQPKKHRSADDLDDNFALEDEKQFMLAYTLDDAELLQKPDDHTANMAADARKIKYNDGISDTSSEEDNNEEKSGEESGGEENADEAESVDNDKDVERKQISKKVKKKCEDESESSDDEDDDDVEETEIEEKPNKQEKQVNKKENKSSKETKETEKTNKVLEVEEEDTILFKKSKNGEASSDEEDSGEESGDEESDEEELSEEEEEKKEVKPKDDFADLKESDGEENSDEENGEEDALKIGSFFELKDGEGENLMELLSGKTPTQQSNAIQKLIQSYDPSLGENNKEKLSRLFAHMLQYINDIFTNLTNEGDLIKAFLIFDKLAPYFYDLAHTNKVSAKKYIVKLLKEKHDRFQKNIKKVPDLDTLIFFKLVSLIYPTSDFKHPVTSPSLLFMSEILRFSRFHTRYAISRGFFIMALILEYTALSKRLIPSSINFLRGILYSCANTSILNPIQLVPPFRIHKDSKILHLENDCSKMADIENKMAANDLVLEGIDDEFKIRCLFTVTLMFKELFDYFNDLEAQVCMFEPHLQLYSRIDLELYPKKVVNTVNDTLKYVKERLEVKTFTPLTKERQAPKLLRLYEPEYQEVFTGSKNPKLSRELANTRRLQSRMKNERKGALREIRRDRAFIVNMRLRQRIQSDNVRKEKVKQIYKDAAIQQGELNKLKRMK